MPRRIQEEVSAERVLHDSNPLQSIGASRVIGDQNYNMNVKMGQVKRERIKMQKPKVRKSFSKEDSRSESNLHDRRAEQDRSPPRKNNFVNKNNR